MKAINDYNVLHMTDRKFDVEHSFRKHRLRLHRMKPSIDNKVPESVHIAETGINSPKKADSAKIAKQKITRENLFLAKRIFNIMEGPGVISDIISNTKHVDLHPGTLNFRLRLKEARRIHSENMAMAARLDSMKPFYAKADVSLVVPMKQKVKKYVSNATPMQGLPNIGKIGSLSHNAGDSVDYIDTEAGRKISPNRRPQNVLLEYTKIQNGRVLDVAVIKEPFRDRYAIFGIDIDNGQRYEFRLSSEDVSSILDGDILVTSVDNVEVWMALLNKVELQPVDAFAKLPATPVPESSREEAGYMDSMDEFEPYTDDGNNKGGPVPPSQPATSRPSSRPGGRNVRAVKQNQNGYYGGFFQSSEEEVEPESLEKDLARRSVDDILSKAYESYSSVTETKPRLLAQPGDASNNAEEDVWEDMEEVDITETMPPPSKIPITSTSKAAPVKLNPIKNKTPLNSAASTKLARPPQKTSASTPTASASAPKTSPRAPQAPQSNNNRSPRGGSSINAKAAVGKAVTKPSPASPIPPSTSRPDGTSPSPRPSGRPTAAPTAATPIAAAPTKVPPTAVAASAKAAPATALATTVAVSLQAATIVTSAIEAALKLAGTKL